MYMCLVGGDIYIIVWLSTCHAHLLAVCMYTCMYFCMYINAYIQHGICKEASLLYPHTHLLAYLPTDIHTYYLRPGISGMQRMHTYCMSAD